MDCRTFDSRRQGTSVRAIPGKPGPVPPELFALASYVLCRAAAGHAEKLKVPNDRPEWRVKSIAVPLIQIPEELSTRYTSAVFRRSEGMVNWVTRTAPAVGLDEHYSPRTESMTLGEGDVLLLYTDGLTESFNTEGVFFGEERLIEAIKACNCGSAHDLLDVVEGALLNFVQDMPPADDLTMLVLRRV